MVLEKIRELPAPIQIVVLISVVVTLIILITNITIMTSQQGETCRENIEIEITKEQNQKNICKTKINQQKTIKFTLKNTGETEISATSLLLLSNSGIKSETNNILEKTLKPNQSITINHPYNFNNLLYIQIIPGFENGKEPITCYQKAIKETTIKNCQ